MKWSQMLMIFLPILAQISFVFGGTSYEIKNFPSTPYLFREINSPIKKDQIKSLQLISHAHVESLAAEVKKSKAKFEPRFFYRIDVIKFFVEDVGQVIRAGQEHISREKVRNLPAGKYLVVNFDGHGSGISETFNRLPEIIKESGVTPESSVITFYKKSAIDSPQENIQIHVKIKDK